MKITGGEGQLLGGVSQQPIDRRASGTVHEAMNVNIDVMRGVIKRPPMEQFSVVDADIDYADLPKYSTTFDYDGKEFQMVITTGEYPIIRIWDDTGFEQSMVIEDNALQYIQYADVNDLRYTVATDSLYLLNRAVVPQLRPEALTFSSRGAYISLIGSQYQRTYKVSVTTPDGIEYVASYTTPDGSGTGDASKLDTVFIMSELASALVAAADPILRVDRAEDVMRITYAMDNSKYLNITVSDGDGGNNLKVAQGTVSSVDDLPRFALTPDVFTVRPQVGGVESEYYLRFVRDDGTATIPPGFSEYYATLALSIAARSGNTATDAYYGFSDLNPKYGNVTPDVIEQFTVEQFYFRELVAAETVRSCVLRLGGPAIENLYQLDIQPPIGDPITLYNTADDGNTFTGVIDSALMSYVIAAVGTTQDFAITYITPSEVFSANTGRYVETVAPGIPYRIADSTMPLRIRRSEIPYTWEITAPEWEARRVGNAENNRVPSFIGRPLRDIGMYQGRLALLSVNSLCMSRTDKLHDFWRSTATAVVASDRLDMETRVRYANQFQTLLLHDRDLLVFADDAQYALNGGQVLTPSNAALPMASRYESYTPCIPTSMGASVAYVTYDGRFSQLREYFTRSDTKLSDSNELSTMTRQYMRGTVEQIVTDSTQGITYLVSAADRSTVWVYTWYRRDSQQAVGAWTAWHLPYEIEHMWYGDGKLNNLVIRTNPDGTKDLCIYRVDTNRQDDGGLGYRLYLDEMVTVTADETGLIHIGDLPTENLRVVGTADTQYPGMSYEYVDTGEQAVRIEPGDEGKEFILGYAYDAHVQLNQIVPKDNNGETDNGVSLRVGGVTLRTDTSGPFTVKVVRTYGDYFEQQYAGIVGYHAPNMPAVTATDTIDVPVRERSEFVEVHINADSHLPFNLTGYDWHGQLFGSGQRRFFK